VETEKRPFSGKRRKKRELTVGKKICVFPEPELGGLYEKSTPSCIRGGEAKWVNTLIGKKKRRGRGEREINDTKYRIEKRGGKKGGQTGEGKPVASVISWKKKELKRKGGIFCGKKKRKKNEGSPTKRGEEFWRRGGPIPDQEESEDGPGGKIRTKKKVFGKREKTGSSLGGTKLFAEEKGGKYRNSVEQIEKEESVSGRKESTAKYVNP